MSKTWRVKNAVGVVHMVPEIHATGDLEGWFYMLTDIPNLQRLEHETEAQLVRRWAYLKNIDMRAMAEPGELFASEQVEAEFERIRAKITDLEREKYTKAAKLGGERHDYELSEAIGMTEVLVAMDCWKAERGNQS